MQSRQSTKGYTSIIKKEKSIVLMLSYSLLYKWQKQTKHGDLAISGSKSTIPN
jgi:hypothetical protein